jgi:hypothetical protein
MSAREYDNTRIGRERPVPFVAPTYGYKVWEHDGSWWVRCHDSSAPSRYYATPLGPYDSEETATTDTLRWFAQMVDRDNHAAEQRNREIRLWDEREREKRRKEAAKNAEPVDKPLTYLKPTGEPAHV